MARMSVVNVGDSRRDRRDFERTSSSAGILDAAQGFLGDMRTDAETKRKEGVATEARDHAASIATDKANLDFGHRRLEKQQAAEIAIDKIDRANALKTLQSYQALNDQQIQMASKLTDPAKKKEAYEISRSMMKQAYADPIVAKYHKMPTDKELSDRDLSTLGAKNPTGSHVSKASASSFEKQRLDKLAKPLIDGQIQQGSEDERMIQRLGGTGGTPRSNFTRLHAGSMSELDPHGPMFAQSPEVSLDQQRINVDQSRVDLGFAQVDQKLGKNPSPKDRYNSVAGIVLNEFNSIPEAREAAKTNPKAKSLIESLDSAVDKLINPTLDEPFKTNTSSGGGADFIGPQALSSSTPNISEVIQRATPDQGNDAQPSINPWAVNNPQKIGPFTAGPDTSSNRPKRKLTPNEAKLLNKAKAIFKTDPAKAEELLKRIGR